MHFRPHKAYILLIRTPSRVDLLLRFTRKVDLAMFAFLFVCLPVRMNAVSSETRKAAILGSACIFIPVTRGVK